MFARLEIAHNLSHLFMPLCHSLKKKWKWKLAQLFPCHFIFHSTNDFCSASFLLSTIYIPNTKVLCGTHKLSAGTVNVIHLQATYNRKKMATNIHGKQTKNPWHSRLCAAGVLKYFNRIIVLKVCSQVRALAKIIHTHIDTTSENRIVAMLKRMKWQTHINHCEIHAESVHRVLILRLLSHFTDNRVHEPFTSSICTFRKICFCFYWSLFVVRFHKL